MANGADIYKAIHSLGDRGAKEAALQGLSEPDYQAYRAFADGAGPGAGGEDAGGIPGFLAGVGHSIERGIVPAYLEDRIPGAPTRGWDGLKDLSNLPENAIDAAKLAAEGISGTAGGIAGAATGSALGPVGTAAGLVGGGAAGTGAAKMLGDKLGIDYAAMRGYISPEEVQGYKEKANIESAIAAASGGVGEGVGGLIGKALFTSAAKGTGRKAGAILETAANQKYTNIAKNVDPDATAVKMAEGMRSQSKKIMKEAGGEFDKANQGFSKGFFKPPKEKVNFLKSGEETLADATDFSPVLKDLPDSEVKQKIIQVLGADKIIYGADGKIDDAATKLYQKRAISNATGKEVEAARRYLKNAIDNNRLDPDIVPNVQSAFKKVNDDLIKKTEFANPITKYEKAIRKTSSKTDPTLNQITQSPPGEVDPVKLGDISEDVGNYMFGKNSIKLDSSKKAGELLKGAGKPVKEGDIVKGLQSKALQGDNFIEPSVFGRVKGKITKDQLRSAKTFANQYKKLDSLDNINFLANPEKNVKDLKGAMTAKNVETVSGSDIINYNSQTLNKYFQSPRVTKTLKNLGVSDPVITSFQNNSASKAEAQSLYKAIEKIAGNPSLSTSVGKKIGADGILPTKTLLDLAVFARMNGAKGGNFLRSSVETNAN